MRALRVAALAALALSGCGDDPGPTLPRFGLAAKSGAPGSVDRYLIHYGRWDAAAIALAKTHDLVILHPRGGDVDRALVAELQAAGVLVLGYLTAGEDDRTNGLTPAQMRADPRFAGDGSGPRVDPRGPGPAGRPLTGLDPLGAPSPRGAGFASWYLDDASPDGVPDASDSFGGAYVNAGDPKWFDVADAMTLDGPDRRAGLREILTTSAGRGLGCDGVFLDTFDTCAPNHWSSRTEFEWTAAGFAAFARRLRERYPDRLILQNRGLFFFNPELPHYRLTTRPWIDFAFFESYRLNSTPDSALNPHPVYYPANRNHYMPKLMAEAGRPDGFRVLSLGYAEGSPGQMSTATLTGGSTLGFDSLLEDIRVTQELAGFRHALTNARINLPNAFVRDHSTLDDHAPPAWSSTWNDEPSDPPVPRVGIREAVGGAGAVTVRWDVALDKHPVGYALYHQAEAFDFAADPALSRATRVVLAPSTGAGYAEAYGPSVYPYEATISGLPAGPRRFVIRAFDSLGQEERNQVVLTASPAASEPDLGRWSASNDAVEVAYRIHHAGAWDWKRVWIDADRSVATGYFSSRTGVGAEFLIENGRLYRHVGPGWTWSTAATPSMTTDGVSQTQWTFARSVLGSTLDVDLVFHVERPGASALSPIYRHAYSPTSSGAPFFGYWAENDGARVYYQTRVRSAWTFRQVFLDADEASATGFPVGGIGADFLVENGRLYRHAGPGWSWTLVGAVGFEVAGDALRWTIDRSVLGETLPLDRSRLLFAGSGGAPSALSPVYTHVYSR